MPWYVGIDENGLGPQLGPLIVTAVLAKLSQDAARRLECDPRAFLHERLADSKQLVNHRHIALGESWARVLCMDASDPAELVKCLALESDDVLRQTCPAQAKPMCWSSDGEPFIATSAHLDQAHADLDHLRSLGIDVKWARSSITCVERINLASQEGIGRLDLDLHAMEALIVAARRVANTEIVARCGKVGGLMRYGSKFTHLSEYLVAIVEEQRARSVYRLPGIGQVSFLRDAEGQDPLVSLASLVGKWMREVLMGRIVRYFQRHQAALGHAETHSTGQGDILPNASGYNDPVTDRFVRGSEQLRRDLGIPDRCFQRAKKK